MYLILKYIRNRNNTEIAAQQLCNRWLKLIKKQLKKKIVHL
jgi:hypothetical protein